MKNHVDLFEEFAGTVIKDVLTKKTNPSITITISTRPGGRILGIDAPHGNMNLPFYVGQILNRNIETWCCSNGWLLNGKDPCPEEKVFGVPARYAKHDPALAPFLKRRY